jgi:hypothetical protein
MMVDDELVHLIRHIAGQAAHTHRPFIYGHIANYDPAAHKVRCIVPSMQDEEGNPLLSPWMPIGSPWAGAGYGIQIVYMGGATIQNPTAGEQVMIGRFDQGWGVTAAPCMFFNNSHRPPATNLPEGAPAAAPGDIFISNPSGTLLRFHPNGDLEAYCTGNLITNVSGNATITCTGTASSIGLTAPSGLTVTAPNALFTGNVVVGTGATGTVTDLAGRTVTVQDGIITNIF